MLNIGSSLTILHRRPLDLAAILDGVHPFHLHLFVESERLDVCAFSGGSKHLGVLSENFIFYFFQFVRIRSWGLRTAVHCGDRSTTELGSTAAK